MELGSSSALILIANPTIVEFKDHPRPIFKWYPHVAMNEDLVGVFSHILEGVVYVEDVRVYIHCNIDDLGNLEIKGMHINELMGECGKIKPSISTH